jgi:hypothetical protein
MKILPLSVALIAALAASAATVPTYDASLLEVTEMAAPYNATTSTSLDTRQAGKDEDEDEDKDELPLVWCNQQHHYLWKNMEVYIRKVPRDDIPQLCGRLWGTLKQHHGAICPPSNTHCGHTEWIPGEAAVHWKLSVPIFCNGGCLNSAYWEATHNKFGKMDFTRC